MHLDVDRFTPFTLARSGRRVSCVRSRALEATWQHRSPFTPSRKVTAGPTNVTAANACPTPLRRKKQAQALAREMAKNDGVEHLVHKKDGTIGERNSYGNDSSNIPG